MKLVWLLALCFVLGACHSMPESSHDTYAKTQIENHTTYAAIVAEDVRLTQHWPDDAYSIRFMGKKGHFLLFQVTHLVAAKTFADKTTVNADGTVTVWTGGDGKSYIAYVNPRTRHVEKKVYAR